MKTEITVHHQLGGREGGTLRKAMPKFSTLLNIMKGFRVPINPAGVGELGES